VLRMISAVSFDDVADVRRQAADAFTDVERDG
jgi:hypothetical protein